MRERRAFTVHMYGPIPSWLLERMKTNHSVISRGEAKVQREKMRNRMDVMIIFCSIHPLLSSILDVALFSIVNI